MEERSRRIVETAVALAEAGGFEGVRLRDVAAHAGVALGTLYRRFRSKEGLLIAALDLETRALEQRVAERPVQGASERERVVALFSMATRRLFRRPNLARALVKAAASGDPELAKQVAAFHHRMESMIVDAMRGEDAGGGEKSKAEVRLAYHLNLVWFALMVGWTGGLHGQNQVIEGVEEVVEMLLGRSASSSRRSGE